MVAIGGAGRVGGRCAGPHQSECRADHVDYHRGMGVGADGAFAGTCSLEILGLSLLIGPIGDGTLLRWLLGGLLVIGGLAKLWIGRRYQTDPLFWAVLVAGGLSVVLGALVLLGVTLQLGVILSLELLGSGAALIVMALRLEKPAIR